MRCQLAQTPTSFSIIWSDGLVEKYKKLSENLFKDDIGDTLKIARTADGKIAKWTMASAKNLDLPFLIKDQTDINLRVPLGNHTQHANGALGIRKITVSTENTELAHSNLGALLSLSDNDLIGVTTELKLQKTTIEYKELDYSVGKFVLEVNYKGSEPKLLNCDYPKGTKIWLIPSDSQ